jgi:drug/metabolite transporter (DMT)-like permease
MQSLWMVAASLLFACMGVCVKLGAEQFSAAELVFWRGFVATLLIGGYILAAPAAAGHAPRPHPRRARRLRLRFAGDVLLRHQP